MPLSPIAQRYDRFILDLDGCVWIGDEPTPRAVEAIDTLREAGKPVVYATNDPRSATEDYVARLWGIGVRASLGDVVTVGGALQHLLAETRSGRTAFVVGTEALLRHVTDAGLRVLNGTDLASRAEVVVVGGTEDLVYDDLRYAALAVRRGADFLATARDPTYPQPDGLWPGTGALLAAIEVASDRKAEIVGKPEPQLMLTALDRFDGTRAARWWWATEWTPTWRRRRPPSWTRPWCSQRRNRTASTEWVRARARGGQGHPGGPDSRLKTTRWSGIGAENATNPDHHDPNPGRSAHPAGPAPPHSAVRRNQRNASRNPHPPAPHPAERTCTRSPSGPPPPPAPAA